MASYIEKKPDIIVETEIYDAVVCLTGGLNSNSPEYRDGYAPTANTIVRCNLAAIIAIEHQLPLIISGGGFGYIAESRNYETYFKRLQTGVDVKVEDQSHNTSEAPISIIKILPNLYKKIILVTDAAHMFRAKPIFENAGFIVAGAPTNYSEFEPISILSFFPNIRALDSSQKILHEVFGFIFFKIKKVF